MIPGLKEKLKKENQTAELVKIRGGGEGKVLFFAFLGDNIYPSFCFKTGVFVSDGDLVKREFENLKSARDSLPEELKNTLPQPLDLFEKDGRFVSSEEAMAGRQFLKGDMPKIFDWILKFHKVNLIERKTASRDFIEQLLTAYQNLIPGFKQEPRFIPAVKKFAERIWGKEVALPLIKQHGDFHSSNIFFKDNSLKVVDWGNYGRVFWPAYDLIYFLRRQKAVLDQKNLWLRKYFDFFSMPYEVMPVLAEIAFIIEGLEKRIRRQELFLPSLLDKYFKEELL